MSNEELALQIKAGHTELYSELWENTKRLMFLKIHRLYNANRPYFARVGLELEDLEQTAFLAIADAARAYNPQKEYAFNSYIKFHLRNHIAEATGTRSKKHDPLNKCLNLDELLDNGESESSYERYFTDHDSECPFDEIADKDLIEACRRDLEKIMSAFPKDESAVIRRKYFEGSDNSKMRVSKEMNMSYQKVCRLERKALARFRQPKNSSALQLYRDELIGSKPYTGSGLTRFKQFGGSSVERCVELLERVASIENDPKY